MKIEKAHIGQKVRVPNGYEGKIVEIHSAGMVRVDCSPRGYHYSPFAASDLEPVSDPRQFAIGDKVLATGPSIYGAAIEGKTFEVLDPKYDSFDEGIVVQVTGYHLVKPENLVKCGPCATCEMAAIITSQCKQIADLQGKLDRAGGKIKELKEVLYRDNRNAAYWREELEKLQKEALAESRCDNCQRIAELRQSRDEWKATVQQNCRNAFYWREELEKLQKEALAECKPLAEVAKIYIQISPEDLKRILKERD